MQPISNRNACFPEPELNEEPVCISPPKPAVPDQAARVAMYQAAGAGDSGLERKLREAFTQMQPNQSFELSGLAELKAEASFEAKAKLKTERQADGSFTLEVGGEGTLGVGAPGAGAARVGIAAGTRFHVQTAAEAADLCDALLKGAFVTGGGAPVQMGVLMMPEAARELDNPTRRILNYLPAIAEVKAELVANAQLGDSVGFKAQGFNFQLLDAKLSAQARGGFAVDFEKGELRYQQSVSIGGDVLFQVPFALRESAAGSATVTTSTSFRLPDRVRQQLAQGVELSPDDWARLATQLEPTQAQVKFELEGGGRSSSGGTLDLKTKISGVANLDLEQLGKGVDLQSLKELAGSLEFSLEGEAGVGLGMGFDLGMVEMEVMMVERRRTALGGQYTLGQALEQSAQFLQDGDADALQACRAAQALH